MWIIYGVFLGQSGASGCYLWDDRGVVGDVLITGASMTENIYMYTL